MSIAKQIREHIQNIPLGEPFHVSSLFELGAPANVRQVICRLQKAGDIAPVTRGIFVRPKETPYLGAVMPGINEVVHVIEETTGSPIVMHGAEAVRRLGLSTQMQMQPVFYTTGNNRCIRLGGFQIRLKHISPRKIVRPGTVEGLVISALWYMKRQNVTLSTIAQIQKVLSPEDFEHVVSCISLMPEWMGKVFYLYKRSQHDVAAKVRLYLS